jgi:hypothetical protein
VRVLLDSCVPRKLAREISAHEVRTAPQLGWGDLDDGPLLTAISGGFNAFITVDKSLRHQQTLATDYSVWLFCVLRQIDSWICSLLYLSYGRF